MSVKGLRAVFGHAPLLLGKNPARPAPVHVINGFLTSALGIGAAAKAIRTLLASGAAMPTPPVAEAIRTDPARATRLRKALAVALNPDRRVWGERLASVFPLHRAFVAHDPSDDGFGQGVWALIEGDSTLRGQLTELLEPVEQRDALTILGSLLADSLGTADVHPEPAPDIPQPWPTRPNTLGSHLAKSLRDLISAGLRGSSGRHAKRAHFSAHGCHSLCGMARSTPNAELAGARCKGLGRC